ncbi:hypothetical protein DFA_12189 [Cavenderia fasciculata]|uniref:Uncharacterized protein n=1 Tax=Cavenderia fasciculata TaxID=261658 RepID=F4QCI9_CACFS|nr:uncharacterized protein DFA_12189 [Cavenderia fasciculata]EGG14417.1 hypothetical protein DFA_12189 [Cavenderia fasciculata]|eukprot:XP_004353826.1 hypothetical protein DFA_12189 [Cavenderia fasciculata]
MRQSTPPKGFDVVEVKSSGWDINDSSIRFWQIDARRSLDQASQGTWRRDVPREMYQDILDRAARVG